MVVIGDDDNGHDVDCDGNDIDGDVNRMVAAAVCFQGVGSSNV